MVRSLFWVDRCDGAIAQCGDYTTLYRILVSRADCRPTAELYPFNLHDPLPRFLLPLRSDEQEPIMDLQIILEQVYQEAAFDLAIDYSIQPIPPVLEMDFEWFQTLPQI